MLTVLALLALATGIAGVADAVNRGDRIDSVADESGRLGLAALEVYQSLSDADATAASAFLTPTGVEPQDMRERYEADIARASLQLATASASISTQEGADAVAVLSVQLPVYTGLVETARIQNRDGAPIGAAYLRQASGLMRDSMLPAAQRLQDTASAQLAETQGSAGALPWLPLALLIITLGTLGYVQRDLRRRTNRVLNTGLVLATVAMVAAAGWFGVASLVAKTGVDTGREEGTTQIELLAEARIAALQARSAEALALIARGGKSVAENEEVFTAQITALTSPDGPLARAKAGNPDPALTGVLDSAIQAAADWKTVHETLRTSYESGEYDAAVELAIGTEDGQTGKLSNDLDALLAQALGAAGDRFRSETESAGNALTGLAIGMGVLSVLCLVGAANGLQRRIAEYR